MAAHFGSMLLNRRRELGLSIQQVANTVKIRPQIIEYFETENFDAMPPRGYAQGMISSYARYLGLSPTAVVNAYYEDLHAFENAVPGASAGRYQDAAADAHTRGSNDSGRYLMVDGTRGRSSSRYGQRPQQQAGYVSESTSSHTPVSASSLRHASLINARDPQANGRPSESRPNRQGDRSGDAGATNQLPRGDARTGTRNGGQRNRGTQGGRQRPRSDSRPGRGTQQGYRSSQPGSGRAGTGRVAGARAGQNQGRYRQQSQRGDRRGTGRGRSTRNGVLSNLDPRIVLIIGAVVLALLIVLVVSAIKGCVSSSTEDTSTTPTTIVSTDTAAEDEDATSTTEDEDEEDEDADASSSEDGEEEDEDTATVVEDTIVTVEIAEDAVAYVEVKLDGVSVLGEDQVGYQTIEYTVTEQIEITTDSPSDVKVYKNGEKVSYDIKTSGVAKVTITVDSTDTEEESEDDEEESA